MTDFHNPYNFIWTPPRTAVCDKPFAGDADPAQATDHGRLHPEHYTGTIRLRVTARTPLLLVRTPAADTLANGHQIFESRDDIAVTAVKGMLRSAYEAVTNSRYGVFAGHDDPEGMRRDTRSALRLVPGRVERQGGRLAVRLLRGRSRVAPQGAFRISRRGEREHVAEGQAVKPRSPDGSYPSAQAYAARLPRYERIKTGKDAGESRAGLRYEHTKELPAHRDPCWIEVSRSRFFFEVEKIWTRPPGSRPPTPSALKGWVYRTGPTIDNKRQERVFFEDSSVHSSQRIEILDPEVVERYEALVRNYAREHEKEATDRRRQGQRMSDFLGAKPGQTAFGPYVYEQHAQTLEEGDLVFAQIDGGRVSALYPCMISRGLHPDSPEGLLNPSLRPATRRADLSPADRLFGWVSQSGAGRDERAAWRGKVRITLTQGSSARLSPVDLRNEDENGVALTILGGPKPAQARFYVGKEDGSALPNGLSKQRAVYDHGAGHSLRGRKAYWHHRGLPEGYWDRPTEDRTRPVHQESSYHQEYRRPDVQGEGPPRDSQNRSVLGWLDIGSSASFTLHLTNASLEEVGALLYLTDLPEGCYHRLGGGKPLGFGSVRLELDGDEAVQLADDRAWAAFYRSLDAAAPECAVAIEKEALAAFFRAMADAYSVPQASEERARFRTLPFVRDFEVLCRGPEDGRPVHYPRKGAVPDPEGKNYEWFTANEGGGRDAPGLSLPRPRSSDALPYEPGGGAAGPTRGRGTRRR